MPTFLNVITHSLKRLAKLEFFYAINLSAIVYIFRDFGDGPTWYFFDKLMGPCDKGIWQNLAFVSNLVNNFGSKADMCLPWTWFLAVYIQLSLLTPLLVYLMTLIFFLAYPMIIILGLIAVAASGIQVWVLNCGVNSSYDETYWSNVYTKPWNHFTVFVCLGMIFGMFYNSYIEKRQRIDQGDRHENSLTYTMLKYIKKKIVIRIFMNSIGLVGLLGTNILAWYQLANGWSISGRVVFAALKTTIRICGFMLILLPLMLSKSKFLRYFLKIKWLHTLS